jgi:excisionase family DNA binding protein
MRRERSSVDSEASRAEIAKQLVAELPPILSVDETAKVLRISRRTLGKLLALKRIKTIRYTTGGSARVLIPRTSIEAFLAEHLG